MKLSALYFPSILLSQSLGLYRMYVEAHHWLLTHGLTYGHFRNSAISPVLTRRMHLFAQYDEDAC